MPLSFQKITFPMSTPLAEPKWSKLVPRWYQLDGFALAMTELFYQFKGSFDFLILCDTKASNKTDRDFILSGATSAQKFVHTLPNVRASMALQSIHKVCDFVCLQAPLQEGLQEFQALRREGRKPALVQVNGPLLSSKNNQTPNFEAWILSEKSVEDSQLKQDNL